MSNFWVLDHDDRSGDTRLAEWADGEMSFQKVQCPVDPDGHYGLRHRTTPLSVVLPDLEPQDLVWTWPGECLVQAHVLQRFADKGLTGFQALPAKVRFAHSSRQLPQLWELAIRGSAGMASPESGVRELRKCPGCGLTDYSPVKDPTKLVDVAQWDGSDFFRVKPVAGWIFVTDRVIGTLKEAALTGWRARTLLEVKPSFDIALPAEN